MRNPMIIAAALAFIAAGATAQAQTPPAKNGPQNSAVNTTNSTNRAVDAPVKGRNSFTEGEAKSRIEAKGFTDVTKLVKDDAGVWRGQAMKNGTPVDVSLDYQGNVLMSSAGQGSTTGQPVRGNAGH